MWFPFACRRRPARSSRSSSPRKAASARLGVEALEDRAVPSTFTVLQGHWKTTTFVAALRADGLTAPMVIDGALNGDLFVAYVGQVLVPALRPGDVVVMDNLSSHKRAGVRQAIERAGCRVEYLPPFSPDLNPIEQAFAKLKALLRKARQRAVAGLWDFLGQALDAYAPDECRNYFRHCGYHATQTSKVL